MASDETLTPHGVGTEVSLPSNRDDEGPGQDSVEDQQSRSLLNSNLFVKVVALIVLLVGWQIASWIMGEFLLPGPVAVSERLVQVILEEDFVRHMSATLYRVVIGLILSLILAIAVGVPMGRSRLFERFFEPYVLLGLTVPGLAWALIAIMIFGIGNSAPIFAITVTSTPMIILNMWQGTKSIDRDVVQMASAFRVRRWQTFRHVVVPQIVPYILAGTRLGFALAWKIVVISEMFGLSSGVGYALNINFSRFSISGIIAWTVAFTTVMGIFEFGLFRPVEKRVTKWRPSTQGR